MKELIVLDSYKVSARIYSTHIRFNVERLHKDNYLPNIYIELDDNTMAHNVVILYNTSYGELGIDKLEQYIESMTLAKIAAKQIETFIKEVKQDEV